MAFYYLHIQGDGADFHALFSQRAYYSAYVRRRLMPIDAETIFISQEFEYDVSITIRTYRRKDDARHEYMTTSRRFTRCTAFDI